MKSPGDGDEGVSPLHCHCYGEADHKSDLAGSFRDVEALQRCSFRCC